MIKPKFLANKIILVSCLILPVANTLIQPSPVQAQSPQEWVETLMRSQKKTLGDASGRTRGGATRGSCPTIIDEPVVVLAPKNNVGATTKASPTFLFYVPYDQSMGVKAQFSLLDQQNNLLTKIPIELPEKPGLVRFTLPSNESVELKGKSLEVGQRYEWFFSIVCSPDSPSRNPSVSGWIERVAPSPELERQLQEMSPEQSYLVYREMGIWYEAIDQLAQNRDRYPDDWADLLVAYQVPESIQGAIAQLQPYLINR